MGEAASGAVPALIETFADDDADVRRVAASALVGIGASVVTALGRALRHEGPQVRRLAAETLGRFGPGAQAAVAELQAATQDQDRKVRQSASKALTRIQSRPEGSRLR